MASTVRQVHRRKGRPPNLPRYVLSMNASIDAPVSKLFHPDFVAFLLERIQGVEGTRCVVRAAPQRM